MVVPASQIVFPLEYVEDYHRFSPEAYLHEYYRELGEENTFLLRFYHDLYSRLPVGLSLLEFGGGPTVYQLLSAARSVKEIVFAEYLECNRQQVARWLYGDGNAFNWDCFLDYTLMLEGKLISPVSRQERRNALCGVLTQFVEADAFQKMPVIGVGADRLFDIVSSSFCLECVTGSNQIFVASLARLGQFLKPNGWLVLTMIEDAQNYRLGSLLFPATPVSAEEMHRILTLLGYEKICMNSVRAEEHQGYSGLLAIAARKCADAVTIAVP